MPLTAGLLVLMPWALPSRIIVTAADVAQQAAIREAMEGAPYRIGNWMGTEVALPPAAIRLLHPNAALGRRFSLGETGMSLSLLIVHCTDARDMRGHYPPVCYPSSGWSFEGPPPGRPSALMIEGRRVPVRMYEFRRIEGGSESSIRVFNLFILPDGATTPDLERISWLSERLALSTQGVAQMQIVTSLEVGEQQAADAAAEILGGMPDLFKAFRVKGSDDGVAQRD